MTCREQRGDVLNWLVYIIRCSDGSLYTGITTDLSRRFRQHAEGRGAKYFRGRRPEQVVHLETGHTRSSAGRREAEIKSLNQVEKTFLVSSARNEIAVHYPGLPGESAFTPGGK